MSWPIELTEAGRTVLPFMTHFFAFVIGALLMTWIYMRRFKDD